MAYYTHRSQVQVSLPDGKHFITDNLRFKTVEGKSGETIVEVIINETKLSKATDFSSNQKEFVNLVKEGIKTDFVTRSARSELEDILPQGSKIEVKGITKTVKEPVVHLGNLYF